MTTKKTTTKKRRAATTLEGRAQWIAAGNGDYDADTRRAVELSLNDLRVTVRRAEAGETVLDMTDPAQAAADAPALADLISAVLKHPETPTDLYNALGEQMTAMSNAIDHDSPEHLRLTLAYYARQEREAAG